MPVFHINYNIKPPSHRVFISRRKIDQNNTNTFKTFLDEYDWTTVTDNTDPASSFSLFYRFFFNQYNKCFPIKRIEIKYKTRIPWLTNALKISISNKNKLYKRWKKCPTSKNLTSYKTYRNKLNSVIRRAERDHYDSLLSQNIGNSKKTWNILKTVINQRPTNNLPEKLNVNGTLTDNKQTIANGFNSYFANVGTTLASKIPKTNINPLHFLKERNLNSIYLKPVTTDEVTKIINKLKNSSSGWDGVSPSVIKDTYPSFLEPLVHILNLSISNGYFPDELK